MRIPRYLIGGVVRQAHDRLIPNSDKPFHPGEFLAEILEELQISQAQFARAIDVSPMRVSHIINVSSQ